MTHDGATKEQVENAMDDLGYRIELGARYHQRRRSFFDSLGTLLMVLSLFGASGAVAIVLSDKGNEGLKVGVLVVLALAQAISLAVRPDQKAREHARIASNFVDVERALRAIAAPTPEAVRAVTSRMLDVEREEPPTKRVLMAIVRNECSRRVGDPNRIPITWWQRTFAHFFDVSPDRLELPGS